MKITSLKELKERGFLELGDIVIFNNQDVNLEYKVKAEYMYSPHCYGNDEIFGYLKIEDKYAFCSSYYGYTTSLGYFPEYKEDDYKALYRLVVGLYEVFESRGIDGFICFL